MAWSLPAELPQGRLIVPDPQYAADEPVTEPVLWVSDDPVAEAGTLWARLLSIHRDSGLWPLLLMGRPVPPWRARLSPEKTREEGGRPWHSGELAPVPTGRIDEADVGDVLAEWWNSAFGDEKWRTRPWNVQRIQPFQSWPGLAPPSAPGPDPDERAALVVTAAGRIAELTLYEGDPYVGLAQAEDGAAAIASSGWLSRAGGSDSTAAVVRSWQGRFGARLCSLSMDTLGVSVAWPPTSLEQARRIAAEHFAFCPDLVVKGTLDDRARSLVDAEVWAFWWD
jgi:hypothetical protein